MSPGSSARLARSRLACARPALALARLGALCGLLVAPAFSRPSAPASLGPVGTDPTATLFGGRGSTSGSTSQHAFGLRAESEATSEIWTDEEFESNAAEIAEQIEELVGQSFLEPVPIELVDRPTFIDRLRIERERSIPTEEVRELAEVAKLLGMLPGDLDLSGLLGQIGADSRGGFYDSEHGRVIMLRDFTGPIARVVMAFGFANALTDQYFGAEAPTEQPVNADQRLARLAVFTGSSLAVLGRWMDVHLPPLTPLDYLLFHSRVANSALNDAPPYVWRPAEGLAQRGESFLRRTNVVDPRPTPAKPSDVMRALSDPPLSTEQLLHPVKYWKGSRLDQPRELSWSVESLPEGWQVSREDTLGELYLGVLTLPPEERVTRGETSMLELVSTRYTTDAADGWDGDRYLLLSHGDSRVLRLQSVWDSPEDAREFFSSVLALEPLIEEQKASMPAHDAALAGIYTEYDGRDRVTITSWNAVERGVVESLLRGVQCAEPN